MVLNLTQNQMEYLLTHLLKKIKVKLNSPYIDNSTDLNWQASNVENNPSFIEFDSPPDEILKNMEELQDNTPLGFFRLLFNDDIISIIANSTNQYVENKLNTNNNKNKNKYKSKLIKGWTIVSDSEIIDIILILIYMSFLKLPSYRDYWTNSNQYGYTTSIPAIMKRNRFQAILGLIHFSDIFYSDEDKLGKIRDFLDFVNFISNEYLIPGEILVLDESIIPFKGRLEWKQFIPSKRTRFGEKAYLLCTRKGYILKTKFYTGKDTLNYLSNDNNLLFSERISIEMLQGYVGSGRTLVADNYYNSIPLALYLLKNKTHIVGTIRNNRKGIPKCPPAIKFKKGDIAIFHSPLCITISLIKPKDNKTLHFILQEKPKTHTEKIQIIL